MADGSQLIMPFQAKVDFHHRAYDAVLYKLQRSQGFSEDDLKLPLIQGSDPSRVITQSLGENDWLSKRDEAITKSGLTASASLTYAVDEITKEAIHRYLQAFHTEELLYTRRRTTVQTQQQSTSREQTYLLRPEGRKKITGILTNHVLNGTINSLRAAGLNATGAQALSGAIIRQAVAIQTNVSIAFTRVEPQLGPLPNGFTAATITQRDQRISNYWRDTAEEMKQDRERILHQEGGNWR